METVKRFATLALLYNGTDISEDIAGSVLSFSVTDNASGKADDLAVTLEDRDGKWRGTWFPEKGAELTAALACENFVAGAGVITYPAGIYTIDEIEMSGPPSVVSIKATSADLSSALRREQKTKAWESVSLDAIANEMAARHSLSLVYDAATVAYDRADQREESDLGFLDRLCKEAGLNLKVADGKIIVFSGETYDAKAPVLVLARAALASWRITDQAHDIFAACQVDYWDPEKKEALSYTFAPANAPAVGQVLKINERVESLAEAERLAKSSLRTRNKTECTGSIEMMGDPRMFAGNTLELTGLGVFSGKWFVETARHSYDRRAGYRTGADIRRVLDY